VASGPEFQCKNCGWEGAAHELEHDKVETCFGNDAIDTCPKCGNFELLKVNHNSTGN